jgi:hypothetical protein
VGVYAGLPAANAAFSEAKRIAAELESVPDGMPSGGEEDRP